MPLGFLLSGSYRELTKKDLITSIMNILKTASGPHMSEYCTIILSRIVSLLIMEEFSGIN